MKKWFVVLLIAGLSLMSVASTSLDKPALTGGDDITYCHATGAATYVELTTSKFSFYISGHNDHDNDIVPPFSNQYFPDFPGTNWDDEGMAILRNGCVVPPIPGCMDDAALNFNPEATVDDKTCYYECDFTHEVEGLSSPGPWDEWTFDGEVFNRCRLVKTAVQHRDDTTDFLCELESRESEVCETQPDACPNLEGGQFEVPDGYIKPGRRCVPKPFNLKEVSVDVGASCGRSVDGIVYQLQGGVAIDPSGGATLTLDGVDYTASSPWWGGFGTHNWSAVATEGYVIVTADAGSFEINNSDCNESPEDTPETGGGSEIGIVLAGSMTLAGIGFAILGAREWAKEKKEKKG